VQIGGFPAYEKWTNDSGENEVVVMVSDRFVVKASTGAWARAPPGRSSRTWI
jgi:hypothetical protein